MCIIYDFLNYSLDDIKKKFKKEHFEILNIFNKLNVNKRIMDIIFGNNIINTIYNYKLFETIKNNLFKNDNKEFKILIFFSAHDVFLCSFLHSLNFDIENKNYFFDDEIKLIVFKKKNNNKYFIKFLYNDEIMKINFLNNNDNDNNKNIFNIEVEKFVEFLDNNFLKKYSYDDIMDYCNLKRK